MSKVFEVSFISEGKYFAAGIPIEDADIRPFMRKYAGGTFKGNKIKATNLRKNYNTPYYVNDDNEMTSPVVRREIENEQQELDEIEANEPLNDAVADAVAQAQEDYAANIKNKSSMLRSQPKGRMPSRMLFVRSRMRLSHLGNMIFWILIRDQSLR